MNKLSYDLRHIIDLHEHQVTVKMNFLLQLLYMYKWEKHSCNVTHIINLQEHQQLE